MNVGDRVKVKADCWLNPVWEPHRALLLGEVVSLVDGDAGYIEVRLDELPDESFFSTVVVDSEMMEPA